MKGSDSIDPGDINIPCASFQSCWHSAKHVRYIKVSAPFLMRLFYLWSTNNQVVSSNQKGTWIVFLGFSFEQISSSALFDYTASC